MSRPLFFVVAIAIFGALNWIVIAALLRVHPRRRRLTIAVAATANVMWLFLPIVNARTVLSRFLRALFGPPWFAWLVFLILYGALLFLIAIPWLFFEAPRRAGRRPFARFAHAPSFVFLLLLATGSVVGLYDALVPLRIERVPVTIAGLPPALEGRKIALLADLHVGLFTRPSRLRQFFEEAAALHPDLVVIDGDLIDDDPVFVPKLLRATTVLDPKLPLVAVLGNHEMYGQPLEAIARLRGSRIRLLVNEGIDLDGLWIAGVSDYAAQGSEHPELVPNLGAALAQRPPNAFPIVIAHQPRVFDEARRRGIALSLVAHTHGGQCGIRSLHWSLAGLFLPYHMGLYRVGASQLYVNTGTGFWLLPFRLGMTPEITLIELRRG